MRRSTRTSTYVQSSPGCTRARSTRSTATLPRDALQAAVASLEAARPASVRLRHGRERHGARAASMQPANRRHARVCPAAVYRLLENVRSAPPGITRLRSSDCRTCGPHHAPVLTRVLCGCEPRHPLLKLVDLTPSPRSRAGTGCWRSATHLSRQNLHSARPLEHLVRQVVLATSTSTDIQTPIGGRSYRAGPGACERISYLHNACRRAGPVRFHPPPRS